MPMRSLQSGAGPARGGRRATPHRRRGRRAARGSAPGAAAVAAEFIARRHCAALIRAFPMIPRGRKASATTMITKVKTTL